MSRTLQGLTLLLERQIKLNFQGKNWCFIVMTFPWSVIYLLVVNARNWLYNKNIFCIQTLPGKVISVGNIVMGGTGKTPVVISLAEYLRNTGKRPAILTRGYKGDLKHNDSAVLLNGQILLPPRFSSGLFIADEANLYSERLKGVPIVVGASRLEAAKRYLQMPERETVTHWILDDGFQHRKIRRDLDLLLMDSKMPYGSGHLIPLGNLREPKGGSKRASFILLTRANDIFPIAADLERIKKISRLPPAHVKKVAFCHNHPVGMGKYKGISFAPNLHSPVLAITAIADPTDFLANLRQICPKIKTEITLPDHSRITTQELRGAWPEIRSIVTTEKDYWRDPGVFGEISIPVFTVPLKITFSDDDFSQLLHGLI